MMMLSMVYDRLAKKFQLLLALLVMYSNLFSTECQFDPYSFNFLEVILSLTAYQYFTGLLFLQQEKKIPSGKEDLLPEI